MTTRTGRSILHAAAVLLLGAGCSDAPALAPETTSRAARLSDIRRESAPAQRSIEDEFEQISQIYPAFGGAYLDSAGVPVVLMKGVVAAPLVRSEIVARVAARSGAFDAFAASRGIISRYSFNELMTIRDVVRAALTDRVSALGIGIDVRANLVSLRGSARDLAAIRERVVADGVPEDALELVEDLLTAAVSLRGIVRPVTGGLSISRSTSASNYCSAGLQAWANDSTGNPDVEQGRYLLTASDCTGVLGTVTGETFGQPTRSYGLHATEVWDAPLFTGAGCPYPAGYSCQQVDVAVLRMSDSVASTWQRVAISNTSNPPTFLGQLSLNTSIWSAVQGQPVRKVGAASGQRNGTVEKTCFDLFVDTRYILCNVEVKGYSNGGDSGGPVYTPLLSQYPDSPWRSGIMHTNNASKTLYYFSSVGAIVASFGGMFTI